MSLTRSSMYAGWSTGPCFAMTGVQSTRPGAGYNFGRVIGGGVAAFPIQDKKSLKNTNLGVREGMIYLINYITFA